MELLAHKEIAVNQAEKCSWKPLSMARHMGNTAVVQALKAAGATCSPESHTGRFLRQPQSLGGSAESKERPAAHRVRQRGGAAADAATAEVRVQGGCGVV